MTEPEDFRAVKRIGLAWDHCTGSLQPVYKDDGKMVAYEDYERILSALEEKDKEIVTWGQMAEHDRQLVQNLKDENEFLKATLDRIREQVQIIPHTNGMECDRQDSDDQYNLIIFLSPQMAKAIGTDELTYDLNIPKEVSR